MLNTIVETQNEKSSLQLLAAQRQIYANAKRLMGIQLLLVGPVATLAAVVGIVHPAVKLYVALWGLTLLVLDTVWLTPRQKRLREVAARVQERFDCNVLGLKWDTIRAGSPEPAEAVHEQATRYHTRSSKMPRLTDWYPVAVKDLPLPLARLVCQRANCWWDAEQRRAFAWFMAAAVLTAFMGMLWFGMAMGLTLPDLLVSVLMPMSPTIKLGYQQWGEHRDAADRLDRLRERVERIWKDALAAPHGTDVDENGRRLQGEIFDGRRRNPPAFDFIFRRFRNRMEALMTFGAEQLVSEARNALAQVQVSAT